MSARDRIVLTVLPILAVLGAFWLLVLSPARAESGDLATQLAAARVTLDTATQQTAAAAAAEKRFGEDAAAVAALGKAVPSSQQLDSLLYQLDVAAGNAKVKLQSITPAAATATTAPAAALPAGITELDLTLQFAGRFFDLERFLHRVHANTSVNGDDVRVHGRLLSIQGVQLATGDAAGLTATVQAKAYVSAPAAATTTPAVTPPAPAAPTTASAPPTQAAAIGVGG